MDRLKYKGYTILIREGSPFSTFDVFRDRLVAVGFGDPSEVLDGAKKLVDADFETPLLSRIRLLGKS